MQGTRYATAITSSSSLNVALVVHTCSYHDTQIAERNGPPKPTKKPPGPPPPPPPPDPKTKTTKTASKPTHDAPPKPTKTKSTKTTTTTSICQAEFAHCDPTGTALPPCCAGKCYRSVDAYICRTNCVPDGSPCQLTDPGACCSDFCVVDGYCYTL